MKRQQNKTVQTQMMIKNVCSIPAMNHAKTFDPFPLLLYP